MNVFAECLTDWEFADRWRPVAERLAERAQEWPMTRPGPEDFWIWRPIECRESRECGGLLIWTDLVCRADDSVGVTLGAQVDRAGLRCGPLSSHSPGGAGELDDFTLVMPMDEGGSLRDVADALLGWFVDESRRWDAFQQRLEEG
ncbi:hypothetical protein ACFW6S_32180 [Streptomyces sp. NPDC058740]|uniref:hypothetical protein n=1 Tax=Streptomyces sp. NPDC058740 TaxID=3346619 RepID=UPI00368E5972